jgi:hypothetical protein
MDRRALILDQHSSSDALRVQATDSIGVTSHCYCIHMEHLDLLSLSLCLSSDEQSVAPWWPFENLTSTDNYNVKHMQVL